MVRNGNVVTAFLSGSLTSGMANAVEIASIPEGYRHSAKSLNTNFSQIPCYLSSGTGLCMTYGYDSLRTGIYMASGTLCLATTWITNDDMPTS